MTSLRRKFEAIEWPEEFEIEFVDGDIQTFVSSEGVYWDDGQDLEGGDENRANISCCWKKKNPSQQSFRSIVVFVDEIKEIKHKRINIYNISK